MTDRKNGIYADLGLRCDAFASTWSAVGQSRARRAACSCLAISRLAFSSAVCGTVQDDPQPRGPFCVASTECGTGEKIPMMMLMKLAWTRNCRVGRISVPIEDVYKATSNHSRTVLLRGSQSPVGKSRNPQGNLKRLDKCPARALTPKVSVA